MRMATITGSNITSEVLAIEDFPVKKNDEVAAKRNGMSVPSMMESLSKIDRRSVRRKPSYADTWTVGSPDELQVTEHYETEEASIVIGVADDGEMEYNITPNEYNYPHELDSLVADAISHLRDEYRRTGGHIDRIRAISISEGFFWNHEDVITNVISEDCDVRDAVAELCEVVYRYTLGKGIFDILLADQRLEDIYVDAPCEKNRILHMCQHMQTAVSPTWQRSINTPLFPNHATFGRSAYSA